MKAHSEQQLLIDQISQKTDSLARELLFEAQSHDDQTVLVKTFLSWLLLQTQALTFIEILARDFPLGVSVLEHYSDYYRLRVDKSDRTIGRLFGLVETCKANQLISEYAISQTSLEQIFQTFASASKNDDLKEEVEDGDVEQMRLKGSSMCVKIVYNKKLKRLEEAT